MYFFGKKDYFTFPNITCNGSTINRSPDAFNIQVSTQNKAHSKIILQNIIIQNVNDPTNITFSIYNESELIANSYADTTNDNKKYSILELNGFHVVDPDLDLDLVHVIVNTSNNGYVALNSKYLKYLDFNSQAYCKGHSWKCWGSGAGATSQSFVTSPSNLELALNGLTYYNYGSNLIDTISITIFDGSVSFFSF